MPGATSDDELSLHRSSSSYHFALKSKLNFEFVSYSWFQKPFASSFLWLDVIDDWLHLHEISRQMCHDHRQPYELFQDINRIHDEKYHPCLDDLCYHQPLYCLPSNTNLFVFCVIPWVPCYPALFFLTLEYYHLLCQECSGNFTTS